MKYEFHPEARLEFRESAAFYEAAQSGLGASFAAEIELLLGQIAKEPERSPIMEQGVRRRLCRRFPFAILYTIEAGQILILAVMHCSRRPGYWRDRLPQ